ncbi:MAG: dihydroorotase [Lachnospiraceae bacterium]|nr:dihydroorotase [Lachnospiraceae bacterium]
MIIKNGTILSPGTQEAYSADLRIADGLITEIARPGSLSPDFDEEEVLDASSCVIAPGLVDVHVHFRDPGFTWKEDLHTGARAAAAGGFTTVICMANTKPPVDHPDTLSDLLLRAQKEAIRIRFTAAVTKGLAGKELTDFETLAGLGACGFTDDGIPLIDEKLTEQAMRRAKALGLPLSFHEEDPAFIEKSGTNRTAPAVAEDVLVARDCMLSRYTGAVINIQHISSGASVALVRTAKALGAPVFAEATPHHFSLTEEAVEKFGTCAKMNPPLRTEADRQAIIEGLKDGTIDIIATDHAPHSMVEKQKEDFFAAPSGIIGLETSLGLGITNLVKPGHLTLMQLLEKMTVNPARLYRINTQAKPCLGSETSLYGSILPGRAADLVIFNPDEAFTAGNYQSKSENSPFTGLELYGKIHYTICAGQIAWDSSKHMDRPCA